MALVRRYLLFSGKTCKRGLASIIGTMLLIAITVVGGTITAVYTEEIINKDQPSGHPVIELIQIIGYDTREKCTLTTHWGLELDCALGGSAGLLPNNIKEYDERIAVYFVNHSVKNILLKQVQFAGQVYNFSNTEALTFWDDAVDFVPGQYVLADDGTSAIIKGDRLIQAGQTVTMILDLDASFKVGRNTQLKITTGNNSVYVGSIVIGDYRFVG